MKKTDETAGVEVDAEIVDTPKGRAGVLAKFQKANPDFEGEPTDEDLWGFAGEDYDSIKGAHKKNMADQQSFADFLAKNPRFGGIVGMSHGEGNDKIPVGRAIGRMYGDVLQEDDDFWEGVKEYELSQVQSKEELEEAQKNFDNLTVPRLEQFAKDNNLSKEQIEPILQGLDSMALAMYMGDISSEMIDLVYKGLNYDTDVQEAATTGEIEGKNTKIRAEMQKKIPQEGIVDLGAGTGVTGQKEKVVREEKGGSFADMLEEVE